MDTSINFKYFLLNESRVQLGQRVGDILSAVQDLEGTMDSMGTRQQVKNAEMIANQIRRILHSNWREEEKESLEDLQKVGVGLLKAIDEKDDLKGVLGASASELENISGRLGVPIQQTGPEGEKEPKGGEEEAQPAPPQGEEPPQPPQQQQQPAPPPQGMPGQQPGAPMAPMPGAAPQPPMIPGGAPPGAAMGM